MEGGHHETFGHLAQSNVFFHQEEDFSRRRSDRWAQPLVLGANAYLRPQRLQGRTQRPREDLYFQPQQFSHSQRPQSPADRLFMQNEMPAEFPMERPTSSRNSEVNLLYHNYVHRLKSQMQQLQRDREVLRDREEVRQRELAQNLVLNRERQARLRERKQQLQQVKTKLNYEYPRKSEQAASSPSYTLLKQYRRKEGPPGVFGIQQSLRQKLQNCEVCSTNVQIKQCDSVCIEPSCPARCSFVCDLCTHNLKDKHYGHGTVPLLALLYKHQRKEARPEASRVASCKDSISMIQTLKVELNRLQKILDASEHILTSQLAKSQEDQRQETLTSDDLQQFFQNAECSSLEELQAVVKNIVEKASPSTPACHVEAVKQFSDYVQKFAKELQGFKITLPGPRKEEVCAVPTRVSQESIGPLKVLHNNFSNSEVQLSNTMNQELPQLGTIVLMCEGETLLRLNKVSKIKCCFRGKRTDKQLRSLLQLVEACSKRKKYKGTQFTLDYKANFLTGLQPPSLLGSLSRLGGKELKIKLAHFHPGPDFNKEVTSFLSNLTREMNSLDIVIGYNPLYFSPEMLPVLGDGEAGLTKAFVQALGPNLTRFHFSFVLGLQDINLQAMLQEMWNKPFLLHFSLDECRGHLAEEREKLQRLAERRLRVVKYAQLLHTKGCHNSYSRQDMADIIAEII